VNQQNQKVWTKNYRLQPDTCFEHRRLVGKWRNCQSTSIPTSYLSSWIAKIKNQTNKRDVCLSAHLLISM
jgi:hypothetical protein